MESTTESQPLMLDDSGSARLYGISRATFRRLVSAGIFPQPIKFGRSSRWKRSDLEAFVDELEPGDTVEIA